MTLVLGLLAVLAVTTLAAAGMISARRAAPVHGYYRVPEHGAAVFGVLGTIFAVILAFVILLALQSYDTARLTAGREAVAVTQMHRTSALLPEPAGATLRGQLACYGRAVAEDEWPIMSEGRESRQVEYWLDEIGLVVADLSPESVRESTAYAQWFERDTDRREGRRGRLAEATPLVPTFLWFVLLVTAVLVVGSTLLFADRRERRLVQVAMVGTLTATITLGLLVVHRLDRPYTSIEPGEMRRTLALMETTRLPVPTTEFPPCDERGRPLAG